MDCIKSLVLFAAFLCLNTLGIGQNSVRGSLSTHSSRILVGQPFEVQMEIVHPEQVVVIFPDSSRDTWPFEIQSSEPLPTQTDHGISHDEKVYQLLAWELDSLQPLQFPFWYVQNGDTLLDSTDLKWIQLDPFVENYSDTLKLKTIHTVAEIYEPFPLRAFLILFLGAVGFLILIGLILWRSILKAFQNWKLKREWAKVQGDYHKSTKLLPVSKQDFLVSIQRVWRRYLDDQGKYSLPALTTSEVRRQISHLDHLSLEDQQTLLALCEWSDKEFFAGIPAPPDELQRLGSQLFPILQKEFLRRKEALKS